MLTRIVLGMGMGAFINAFIFASINTVHSVTWTVIAGLLFLSIRNKSSKAQESLDYLKRVK